MAIMFSAHFPYYTLHPPLTPLKLDSESEIWNTPGNKFGIHHWQKPPKSNHHLVFPSWRRTSQSYQTSSLPSASACVESSPHQLCEDYRSIIKTTNITATDEKKSSSGSTCLQFLDYRFPYLQIVMDHEKIIFI